MKKLGYILNLALDGLCVGIWIGYIVQFCRGIQLDGFTIGISLLVTLLVFIKLTIKDLLKQNIKINIKGEIK